MEASVLPPPPPVPPSVRRRKRARRNLAIIAAAVILAVCVLWYIKSTSSLQIANLASFGNSVANEIGTNFSSYPEPLPPIFPNISKKNAKLTVSGVIENTNKQRSANDLPPLAENPTLDAVASLRLDDMFTNQYFAHVSPTGASAESVASSVGYNHLAIGENLAEGIFSGDAGLVTAWMNSPGHRANILNTHYDQIGVAVREGTFQGKDAWIAVQIFGKPASDCDAPDAELKAAIDAAQTQLAVMGSQLQAEKTSLETAEAQSASGYDQRVEGYNNEVAQYNDLSAQTKTQVAQYNDEVAVFNQCLEE